VRVLISLPYRTPHLEAPPRVKAHIPATLDIDDDGDDGDDD